MPKLSKVTRTEANAKRSVPPVGITGWDYYYDDLSCWIATQASRLLVGVEDNGLICPECTKGGEADHA